MGSDSTETLTERELLSALDGPAAASSPAEPVRDDSSVEPSPAAAPAESLLITVDDLEKALGEIEGKPVDSAPVPAPSSTADVAATPPPEPEPASAPGTPAEKPLKFVIGKKPRPGAGDDPPSSVDTPRSATAAGSSATGTLEVTGSPGPAPDASAAPEVDEGIAAPSGVYLASRKAYRSLETGLDLISRPVARLGGRWLQLVGAFGVTTLIVSLGAMFVLPVLMPHEDAVTFLAARREAVANPPRAAADEQKADSHGGAKKDAPKGEKKPKSDGHGSAAKPAKKEKPGGDGH